MGSSVMQPWASKQPLTPSSAGFSYVTTHSEVQFCSRILSGVSSSMASHAVRHCSAVRHGRSRKQALAASRQYSMMQVELASVLPSGGGGGTDTDTDDRPPPSCVCGKHRSTVH